MDFSESLVSAARSIICSYLDGPAAFLRYIPAPLGGLSTTALLESLRSNLSRRLCNRETPNRPAQFEGGQCPDLYRVSAQFSYNVIGANPPRREQSSVLVSEVLGPLRGLSPRTFGPPNNVTEFVLLHAPTPAPLGPSETVMFTFSTIGGDDPQIDFLSVINLDNPADDCGNAPPPRPPYLPGDYSGDVDITYVNNDGIDVTIPVGFVVGLAYIDADLNLNVPVTFTFSPNFNFNPTFKFDIDVNFNFNTGDFNFTPPRPEGDPPPRLPPPPDFDFDFDFETPPAPPPPPDVPTDPDSDDPPPIARVIRGALVTVDSIDEDITVGTLFQDDNPDVWFPDLGIISFEIRTRLGGSGWSEDIRVKNRRQFITCPWPGGALRVRGTPRSGVQFSILPVYGQPDPLV